MGRLIDGKWTDSDESYRQGGAFVRATPAFRSFITADRSSQFPAEAERYHLYVALPCPWCHRTMIFHTLKRLQGVVSISMVDPLMLEGGWRFKQPDPITGAQFVHQLYTLANPHYTGRVSVPVLWTKKPPAPSRQPTSRRTSSACSIAHSAIVRGGRPDCVSRRRIAPRSMPSTSASMRRLTTVSIVAVLPLSSRSTKGGSRTVRYTLALQHDWQKPLSLRRDHDRSGLAVISDTVPDLMQSTTAYSSATCVISTSSPPCGPTPEGSIRCPASLPLATLTSANSITLEVCAW